MVSGTLSLPYLGYFSLSAHATCSLPVISKYLALQGGPCKFTPGFTCLMLLGRIKRRHIVFAYGAITLFGWSFQIIPLTKYLTFAHQWLCIWLPTTPYQKRSLPITLIQFRLFPFRSPLLRESIFLYFPIGTEMFHFPTCPPLTYEFS